MIGATHGNGISPCRDDVGNGSIFGQYDRKRAGPKGLGELLCRVGIRFCDSLHVRFRFDVNNKRVGTRSAFHRKDRLDRPLVEGIRRQAINGLGGDRDEPTIPDDLTTKGHDFRVRFVCIHRVEGSHMSFFVNPVGTIIVPDRDFAMTAPSTRTVPAPTPEQRRIAGDNYERAKQVLATQDHDYAIQLLLTCCKLEPANVHFRMALRKAQKEKYGNNMKGSPLAMFSTPRYKAKVKSAKRSGEYLKVLEYAEVVLTKNPWDLGTQTDLAEAFDALGLLDLAVLTLDQARQKYPKEPSLNRQLARLFEKRGDYTRAIVLWQLVREAVPTDVEASHKAKDLAASETIARGQYEESVAGTKTSPVLDRLEQREVEKQDKVGRDVAAILKRIEADPTEPSLYVQLALAYRKAGQEDRAKAALTQGLSPSGNHHSLRQELLETELDPVRKKLAHATARLAHPREDDDPAHLAGKIRKYTHQINEHEINLFKMKLEKAPSDTSARLELGIRLVKADRTDEAIVELQQARKDEKMKGRSALHLGHAFIKKNNWKLAQRNFEDALAALPDNDEHSRKDVLFQLAVGAEKNGDKPRALELGHELANIDYGYNDIGNLIDRWEGRAGG